MRFLRLLLLLALLVPAVQAEPLPFRQAVELAVKRSNLASASDEIRAHAGYIAAKRMYIPQMIIGSGLAKSWGFPLTIEGSAPSVVSVNAVGFLLNFAQRETIRAARADWQGTSYSTEDKRQQAILDTVLTYNQLDRLTTALRLLSQQGEEAARAEQITTERVEAGVEPQVNLTRAKLASARVRMGMAQLQGSIELLRNQLSQLTGVPAQSIETITESIPELPAVNPADDQAAKATANNPAIRLADSNAESKRLQARSEHKQLYPAIDTVGQYGLFAKYNNYDLFFRQFQRNNGVLGVSIRFPFFNLAQRARAEAADAEAVKARRQVEETKNKISNETLKLQRDVAQLTAAREVARLEYQLARSDVDAVQAKVQTGNATLRDEANARLAEGQKYSAFLDASSDLEQAEMQLLRSTGELEKWALAAK